MSSSEFADIDITNEEIQQFTRAFKNDEFKRLFADYCQEITDPANKRLYESELTQLEAERGIDVTFINPQPGFVIKTTVNGKEKTFINVAQCDRVGRPTSSSGHDKDGSRGLHWSLPYTQSAARPDTDRQGQLCSVYDVVFHPDTLHLAAKNPQFRQMVADTACDAVQSAFGVRLDMVNRKYPKIQFKGAAQSTIIRKRSEHPPPDAHEPSPIDKIYPPLLNDDTLKKRTAAAAAAAAPSAAESSKDLYKVPQYKIVHRKNVDYAEMTEERDAKMMVAIPQTLVVSVDLPMLRSSDEVTLDVTDRQVYLSSEKPAKYKLTVALPYAVDEAAGSAVFDKDKRCLVITLPVLRQADSITSVYSSDAVMEEEEVEDVFMAPKIEEIIISPSKENNPIAENDEKAPEFFDPSIEYELPVYTCATLGKSIVFTLHVKNVDPTSVFTATTQSGCFLQVKFTSIGVGFVPQYYAFCVRFSNESNITDNDDIQPDVWDNNVIVQLQLKNECQHYAVGIAAGSLSEEIDVVVVATEDINEIANGLGTLDITKSSTQDRLAAAAAARKEFKKKGKNKKRLSYSESHCDILKSEMDDDGGDEANNGGQSDDAAATNSIKIVKSPTKLRTYSESSNDEHSMPAAATKGIKGILKRRSISESSTDDHVYSCSIDLGIAGSIPEEAAAEVSESCKKTVRFDNNIRKQLFK